MSLYARYAALLDGVLDALVAEVAAPSPSHVALCGPTTVSNGCCAFMLGRRPAAAAIAESPRRGSGNGYRYRVVVDEGTGCRR